MAALFALSAAGGIAHAWSDNLIVNPGFEQGNDHWGAYAYWGAPDPFPSAQAVQSQAHSGAWSLSIGTATGGRAQTIPKPRPATTYKLGAWGKVSEVGEIGWVGVECYDIRSNQTNYSLEFTSTSYEYKELEFTAPGTIDYMRLFAWKYDGPGYLYVDDISVVGPDLQTSSGNTAYYVDSVAGNDGSSGTSPGAAWRTLAKVNSVVFAPGDQILLKAGSAWTGQLDPYGSGQSGNPIVIDMYGDGPKPLIDGQGQVTAPLRLFNQQYWEVSDIELTNYDAGNLRERFGAWVTAEDAGTLNHIYLRRLDVHDVNGRQEDSYKANGGIIFDIRGLNIETNWNDVLIEGNTVRSVDRSGIWLASYWWDRSLPGTTGGHWVGSTNVVIRNNTVDDIGGDGIVPCMCIGPLVEHNVASNCNMRSGRYCVAIWDWACDDTVIQYNEAYLTRTTMDGNGFDSDWYSHNTTIQYNYSHDNEGGFCLICADGCESDTPNGFNDGTIVRYNISQNDGASAIRVAGPTTNTHVYNNTIYIGPELATEPIRFQCWNGYPDSTCFYNNIFYNLGSGDYVYELSTNNVFDYNVFYGNHPAGEPADPHKLTSDPVLAAPGSAAIGRETCDGYKLQPGSPCIDSGMAIAANGGRDFWGVAVPWGAAADRGAFEAGGFPDVPPDHWAYDEIMACVAARVVAGYPDGYYRPGNEVTRDQMAVYVARALVSPSGDAAIPDPQPPPSFSDVAPDSWGYKQIEYAVSQNVVQGYEDGTYQPGLTVDRGQMAAYIARAMVAPGGDAAIPDPEPPPTFPDVPATFWSHKHVEYCVGRGVVQGYEDGTYQPLWPVTRDQMAVYVARAFELLP